MQSQHLLQPPPAPPAAPTTLRIGIPTTAILTTAAVPPPIPLTFNRPSLVTPVGRRQASAPVHRAAPANAPARVLFPANAAPGNHAQLHPTGASAPTLSPRISKKSKIEEGTSRSQEPPPPAAPHGKLLNVQPPSFSATTTRGLLTPPQRPKSGGPPTIQAIFERRATALKNAEAVLRSAPDLHADRYLKITNPVERTGGQRLTTPTVHRSASVGWEGPAQRVADVEADVKRGISRGDAACGADNGGNCCCGETREKLKRWCRRSIGCSNTGPSSFRRADRSGSGERANSALRQSRSGVFLGVLATTPLADADRILPWPRAEVLVQAASAV